MKNTNIDFVVTWVDGNDTDWVIEKQAYQFNAGKTSDTVNRYRD